MKDQIAEMVQQAASGKMATALTLGTVATPAWIRFVEGDAFSAGMVVIGGVGMVALTMVNVLAVKNRSQQNKLDTAIKRGKLKQMGLDPDNLS